MMKANDLCSTVVSMQRNWRSLMKKRKKGRRFTISAVRKAPEPRAIAMEPEELATYVRRAEKEVLPISKERQLGPGAALFLLLQQIQLHVTGDLCLTSGSGMAIASSVLAYLQEGYYTPGPVYPYTLEETLLELQKDPKAKGNCEASFQPFTPTKRERPRGFGELAGRIVQHPQTKLWQIWMMIDGPCTFPCCLSRSSQSQGNPETIISTSRKGGTDAKIAALYL